MTITDPTPLRADAERNRRRIIDAAAEVFAERGLDVSLDDIAARAGVGVATVYRRFGDKGALIDAVFEAKVADVAEAARKALTNDDPWEGFTSFMTAVCAEQAADQGFKEALLGRELGTERVDRARETIGPVAGELLRRAQEAGRVRADLDVYDVPLLHTLVGFAADATRDQAPEYWRRVLGLLLDGLATRREEPTPLPSPPLGLDAFVAVMSRRRG